MRARRKVLARTLAESGIDNSFASVLDHGGDRGQMLRDLNVSRKAVFDISGVTPDPGVAAVDQAEIEASRWDLILCCHVLEHLPDPRAHVTALAALGHAGTAYYFEVPDEAFGSFAWNCSALQRHWIAWLTRQPRLLKIIDFMSVIWRIKLHVVPPCFFVALREHLNFYSVAGLCGLLQASGFDVRYAARLETGGIGAVAVKSSAVREWSGEALSASQQN
jgi:hypothetical protein